MTARLMRLDVLVVERGLAQTRTRARALVLAGQVRVDGTIRSKAGVAVGRRRRCHPGRARSPVRRSWRREARPRPRYLRRGSVRSNGNRHRGLDGGLHRRPPATGSGTRRRHRRWSRAAGVEAASRPPRRRVRPGQRPPSDARDAAPRVPAGRCDHHRRIVHLARAHSGSASTAALPHGGRDRVGQTSIRGWAERSREARHRRPMRMSTEESYTR